MTTRDRTRDGDPHAIKNGGAEGADHVERAADELYASSLSEFVERRRALAKALRADGDPHGAKRVGAMAKPSVSAWAVNQLWWSHRERFEALLASALALRQTADARALFEAQIRAMRSCARDILVEAGHGDNAALLRRVATTLHAITALGSFAPDANGRAVSDREPPGFEALEGTTWTTRRATFDAASTNERGRPESTALSQAADDARRAAAQEQAILDAKRELDGLKKQLSQAVSAVAAAQREIEAAAAAQAKIDAERSKAEKAKAQNEHAVEKVQARIEEIERSLLDTDRLTRAYGQR
jgi:creatinine amidohydrolase/Fe(II)-dependent formamide hydrolase-like protein